MSPEISLIISVFVGSVICVGVGILVGWVLRDAQNINKKHPVDLTQLEFETLELAEAAEEIKWDGIDSPCTDKERYSKAREQPLIKALLAASQTNNDTETV